MDERKKMSSWYEHDDAEESDDFYSEVEIETLLEDDEISTAEEAFMQGYLEA